MDAAQSPSGAARELVAGRAGYLVCLGYDGWAPERVVESLAGLGYRWCEWSLHHYEPGEPATSPRLKPST
jgi:hypothetical protein